MRLFFWKKQAPKLRPVNLPGECGTVCIPEPFTAELENDQTLLAYPAGSKAICLRFSAVSFAGTGATENEAAEVIRKKAADEGAAYRESNGKGITWDEGESDEDGQRVVLKHWGVGTKTTIVIITATIPKAEINSRTVNETLQVIPHVIDSIEITKTHMVAEAEGRQVPLTQQTAAAMPQTIREFANEDQEWLRTNRELARDFGLKYGSGGEQDPEELDRIFYRWHLESDDREEGEIVANALGSAFGDYLVGRFGFRWVVVADEFGIEFAVQHQLGDTMAFPRASVQKRLDEPDPDVFKNLNAAIAYRLQEAEKEAGQGGPARFAPGNRNNPS
jgi:hypothetical protein